MVKSSKNKWQKDTKTRANDVSPNLNRTQAAKITPGIDGVVASAAG